MPAIFDADTTLRLPSTLSRATCAWSAATGRSSPQPPQLPDFRVALLGPPDSGKTALLRALLEPEISGLIDLAERPGPDTRLPLEICHGKELSIWFARDTGPSGRPAWQRCKPGRRRPVDIDQLAARHEGADRVRVALPVPLLSRWSMRLLDLPSLGNGPWQQERRIFDLVDQEATAALYLLNSRGRSDVDLEALQRLRSTPTALLANIRDAELLPDKSRVELVQFDGLPLLRPGFVVPLIIHAVRDPDGTERKILIRILALLRRIGLQDHLEASARVVAQQQRLLEGMASGHLRRVHQLAASQDYLQRLEASARLLQLDRWLKEHGVPAAEEIAAAGADLSRAAGLEPGDRETALQVHAEDLIQRYNIRAGRRPGGGSGRGTTSNRRRDVSQSNSATGAVPAGKFGQDLVEARRSLVGFLDNILQVGDVLDLGPAEKEALEGLAAQVRDGRVDLALLGMFSSGKSSVINTLLGIPNDDNRPVFLPTKVTPETSTINTLQYSPKPRLLEAVWLEEAELSFLGPSRLTPGMLRVHAKEIETFCRWLETGEVRWEDCELTELGGAGQKPAVRGAVMKKLRRAVGKPAPRKSTPPAMLQRLLEVVRRDDGTYHGFVGLPRADEKTARGPALPVLPNEPVLQSVHIQRFARPPRNELPATLQDAFSVARDPATALRVRQLNIGFPHELLRHAAIIDTPGTDSPFPHHRRMAREIVRYRRCPVLYCFLGTQPGGQEDKENIQFLRECNVTRQQDRVFFVITRKGLFPRRDDQDQILRHVKGMLAEVGIQSPQLYFVEAVGAQDEEFRRLEQDIERFAMVQRGAEFCSWIERLDRVMDEVLMRARRGLKNLEAGEEQRQQQRQRAREVVQGLEKVRQDLGKSGDWGAPWAWGRVSNKMDQAGKAVTGLLDSLSERDDFDGIGEQIEREVEALSEETQVALRKALEALAGKLHSRIAAVVTEGETRPPLGPLSWDPFFSGSGVGLAASHLEWKSWWVLRFSSTKEENVARNRARLRSTWRCYWSNGLQACRSAFNAVTGRLDTHVSLLLDRARKESKIAASDDVAGDRERFDQMRAAAEQWKQRVADLERQYRRSAQGRPT